MVEGPDQRENADPMMPRSRGSRRLASRAQAIREGIPKLRWRGLLQGSGGGGKREVETIVREKKKRRYYSKGKNAKTVPPCFPRVEAGGKERYWPDSKGRQLMNDHGWGVCSFARFSDLRTNSLRAENLQGGSKGRLQRGRGAGGGGIND